MKLHTEAPRSVIFSVCPLVKSYCNENNFDEQLPDHFLIDEDKYRRYYFTAQWPCGLRRESTAASLLGLWFRIPPGTWMSVSCECFVLSGRGLCDELVPRPEESYRVWCV
jgi:hypothetical protein